MQSQTVIFFLWVKTVNKGYEHRFNRARSSGRGMAIRVSKSSGLSYGLAERPSNGLSEQLRQAPVRPGERAAG